MEKINQPIRKKFPQVKLYLDDLKRITEILKNQGFKKIEIATTTNKYSSDEIAMIPAKTPVSEIKAYDPFYISVNFNKSFGKGVSIYSDTDSAIAEGIVQKIGLILLNRKRKIFSILVKTWVVYTLFILIQALAYFLKAKGTIQTLTMFLIILGAIIYDAFFGFLLDSGILFRKNVFYYKNREEQPSFWIRKKDDIILAILSAIVGSILTIAATIIILKFVK